MKNPVNSERQASLESPRLSPEQALEAVADLIQDALQPNRNIHSIPSADTISMSLINNNSIERNPLIAQPMTKTDLFFDLVKYILTGLLLLGRTLSCFYRYIMMMALMDIIFRLPVLHETDEHKKQYASIATAIFFLSADIFVSVIKTAKNVSRFVGNVISSLRNPHPAREEESYSLDLRALGMIAIFSSGFRGYVGCSAVLGEIGKIPEFYFFNNTAMDVARVATSIFCAISSSVCFYSFQYGEKAVGSWRAIRLLNENEENKENWSRVQQASFYKKEYRWAWMLAIAAGLNAAMAPLFHNGKFSIDTWKLILFIVLGIPNVFFNLRYAYVRVFMLKLVVGEAEKNKKLIGPPEKKAQSFIRMITNINAIGNGLTFSVAVIGTLLIAPLLMANDNHPGWKDFSNSPYLYLGLVLFSIPFTYGSYRQNQSMWQSHSRRSEEGSDDMPRSNSLPAFDN